MADLNYLSDADIVKLRRMMALFDRGQGPWQNTRNRQAIQLPIASPRNFVPVLTPAGGIPALGELGTGTGTGTGVDDVSFANCQVYQTILNAEGTVADLQPATGWTLPVGNLSKTAIPGNTYIGAELGRDGNWYAVALASSSSGGGGGNSNVFVGAEVTLSTSFTATSATGYVINFDTLQYQNPTGFWSASPTPSNLTVPTGFNNSVWKVGGCVSWSGSFGGADAPTMTLTIYKNGSVITGAPTIWGYDVPAAGFHVFSQTMECPVRLQSGDNVSFQVTQVSSTSLTAGAGGGSGQPTIAMWLYYVGSGP